MKGEKVYTTVERIERTYTTVKLKDHNTFQKNLLPEYEVIVITLGDALKERHVTTYRNTA
jgi:hypothetical protein